MENEAKNMKKTSRNKEQIKDKSNSLIYPQGFDFPTYDGGNQTYKKGYYHGYRNAMKIVYRYLDKVVDDNTQQEQRTNKENFQEWLENEGDYIVKDSTNQIWIH